MAICMEDDFTFCKDNGWQSGHPKSTSSSAQGGFERDKKKKWERFPHKGIVVVAS